MGKEKGLKISLFIQEVVKRSPFQVGIEAARQLGSCIIVVISAAAQISVVAAAFTDGCVSVAIDGVSLLCYVLLILVSKCVKERLSALAVAARDLVAATLFAAAAWPKAIQGFLSLVIMQFVTVRSSPNPLVMHGRLRGGSSSVLGDWVCSRCHISGCWPTRAAFVVGLLAIRHPMTLALVFLDVRAITLAGRRSPNLLR